MRTFRSGWLLSAAIFSLSVFLCTEIRACEFDAVKKEIDIVIDSDSVRGNVFRKEFKEGRDSITAMEALVSPDMKTKIDICRYHVGEYLTKRGFPPFH
jgi:hypothetical protein